MTPEYKQQRFISKQIREHNDCAVIAVAVATGKPYLKVHADFKLQGRQWRRRTADEITQCVLEGYGYVIHKRQPKQPNGSQYTMKTVPEVLPLGGHLVFVREHVAGAVDGEIHDWSRDRKHRVREIWILH